MKLVNKFNHKRYKRSSDIERNTYFYVTSKHCGVKISQAPVVETPLAYTRRMRSKERDEAWLQFVKAHGCERCYPTCQDMIECTNAFNRAFVSKFRYMGEP